MTGTLYLSATELADHYRSRSLSPVETITASLARAEAVQPRLNAFRLIDGERAHAEAQASERRWRDGAPLSPLDGVPVVIKDNQAFAGQAKASGSRAFAGGPPAAEDMPLIARLREAGAIMFARTTMPDLGWKGLNDSPLTGVTRNPWNPDMTPGGSSGGSAVAVATGCAPIGTGGDGGGSIRIPAAFTGVYGIKPTSGRLPSLYDSPAGDLVGNGPLTRTVADAALALAIMARPDPRDPFASGLTQVDFPAEARRGVAGLRVAVSANCGFAEIDVSRVGPLEAAAKVLEEAGATVVRADPPIWNARAALDVIWGAVYAAAATTMSGEQIAALDPGLVEVVKRGLMLSAAAERTAQAERTRLTHVFIRFFRDHDILLTPAMPIAPFRAEMGLNTPDAVRFPEWYDWTPYTWPFNLTKMPAASCPWGTDADGLPQAVQVVATHFREDLVLRASAVLEAAHPFEQPPDDTWR